MQFYFFRNIEAAYAVGFRQLIIRQNVTTARYVSGITAVLSTITGIVNHYNNFISIAPDITEYQIIHNFLFFSSFSCFILLWGLKLLKLDKRNTVAQSISLLYSLCIILGCMGVTFIAQHNPANTITMFMLGVFTVGVLWTFTALQTAMLSLVTLVTFFIGLRYIPVEPARVFPSEIIAFCIVVMFFCISRIFYSYHANNFIQVRKITAKSEEIASINKLQTEILAVVAHDLRSPMNNIVGLTKLIKDPAVTDLEREEMYDLILQACNETDNIIHDLIDVARKTSEDPLSLSSVRLNDFIASIQQQWLHRVPGNRRLIFNRPAEDIVVNIHKQKVQRVLDNLINNAIKFTNDDGTITISTVCNGKGTITVSDDGIGIPSTLLPYIFDRFSRAGRHGINGEKSYGLGLSICKQIVEAHHGHIHAESAEGHGTKFTITLPAIEQV